MGGAAKHLLELGGSTPWRRTLQALDAHGISPVIAVGPAWGEGGVVAPGRSVTLVREDPPFGGPVAAIAAAVALPALADAEEVLLLAGDLARPAAVVARLMGPDPRASRCSPVADCRSGPAESASRDQRAGADGGSGTGRPRTEAASEAVAGDAVEAVVFRAEGQPQWLAGRYRVAAVRAALAALDVVDGVSCRALLSGLRIRWIPDDGGITADVDTPADLERARAALADLPTHPADLPTRPADLPTHHDEELS